MTTDQLTEIDLAELHDSPTNPRQVFDDTSLQELAADVRAHGRVLQPLLVRPRIPALFAGDDAAACGFEIVFGHRRKRAAELAGLQRVHCMVRAMTDHEVMLAQISENLQRTDVHPVEEAEGFEALIEKQGDTKDSLAERFGKSRTYVYGRLKLLNAVPSVRKACVAGEIGPEVMLYIARLGHPRVQEKALARIKAKALDTGDGGKHSVLRIKDLLRDEFTVKLKEALFPTEDETLVPEAGGCAACPKRSANAPEFADVAEGKLRHEWSNAHVGPDICTEPECYQAKQVAFFKRKADVLRADGQQVIDGTKARNALGARGEIKGAYVSKAKGDELVSKARDTLKKAHAVFYSPPKPYTLLDPRDGKTYTAYKLAELHDVYPCLAREIEQTPKRTTAGHDFAREREEAQAAQLIELPRRQGLHEAVRNAARNRPRSTAELRLVVFTLIRDLLPDEDEVLRLDDLWGWHVTSGYARSEQAMAARRDEIATLTADELGLLLLDCVAIMGTCPSPYQLDDEPEALYSLAETYGIDPHGEFTPTPSTAAQSEDGGDDDVQTSAQTESDAGAGAELAAAVASDEGAAGTPAEDQVQMDEAGSAGQAGAPAAAGDVATDGTLANAKQAASAARAVSAWPFPKPKPKFWPLFEGDKPRKAGKKQKDDAGAAGGRAAKARAVPAAGDAPRDLVDQMDNAGDAGGSAAEVEA